MSKNLDKIIALTQRFEKKAQQLSPVKEYQYQIYTMGIMLRELRDSVAPIDNLIDDTHEMTDVQLMNQMKKQIDIIKNEIDKKYDAVKKNYVTLSQSALAANKK
jgi:hypothetical protein